MTLQKPLEERLVTLGKALVDQDRARVIVPPQDNSTGFWFGGGNIIRAQDGTLFLVGRYRNHGDSRTGVAAGQRGLELAIFESKDNGESFEKIVSLSKADLNEGDHEVLSIEGTALHWTPEGVELFVSTEKKNIPYPSGFESYLKPGTGLWTIDHLKAKSIAELSSAKVEPLIASNDLNTVHVKDPFVYDQPNGDLMLLFCTHPFMWSSSNTGYTIRRKGADQFEDPVLDFFPRGMSWDVAITRGTSVVEVPKIGMFENESLSLFFYDGGECVRNLDEHAEATKRPRGYSCEELGGLAYIQNNDFSNISRLSKYEPLFISNSPTGCSRYVDVLQLADGLFATWQQSQADGSQPLVAHFLDNDQIESILS